MIDQGERVDSTGRTPVAQASRRVRST